MSNGFERIGKDYKLRDNFILMGIICLADMLADLEAKEAKDSEDILRGQLSQPVLDDFSSCCSAFVDYSLGIGNPFCSNCGKPLYS